MRRFDRFEQESIDSAHGAYDKSRMEAPADFDGPTRHRSCTDVIFALLMLVSWVAMTAIGIYAWNHGDYRVVLYPMDYDGNICGIDFNGTDMTNHSKIVYINNLNGGVCVKECPEIENLFDIHTLITYGGVYQGDEATLPADYVDIADYSAAEGVQYCDETLCDTDPETSWFSTGIRTGYGFAYYAVDTNEVLNTRCLSNPTALQELRNNITIPDNNILDIGVLDETQRFFNNLYGDIFVTRYYILAFGFGAALVIGFVYAQLLRFQPLLSFMIWGSVLGTLAIIFGTGYYAYTTAQGWRGEDPVIKEDFVIKGTEIFSYVLFGVGAIVLFLTIFLRKQIMLSMACVREAARAIGAMPLLVIFPIIQTIGLLIFMVIWVAYAVQLASTGEVVVVKAPVDTDASVRSFQFDEFTTNCGWYHIFCLLWTSGFISAVGNIIISMSVAKWYFTRDKSEIGSLTVLGSIYDAMRYHLGTAAFGSFIIAVTQIIRMIVARAQKKARELNNKLGEALLCCCQCCLWCFEKVIKFLNKNAYIQTAIFGTAFCKSAREAFSLIVRNAGKVATITYVSTVVLFVGKVFISSITAGTAYIYINNEIGDELYSLAGPTLIIFLMSYFIGDMFLDVFDMSTNTVLQCFVADEEMFDGYECYAEGNLREWLDDFEESSRKLAV